jgi:hypothetical protein
MTTRDLDTLTTRSTPQTVSQATAVEQARAVAEVQAAIVVAQQVPRNMDRANADMRDATGRLALAEQAFYKVPDRGTGPTVHLMRELARIWGNITYGVRELHRDDDTGMSEILAYAVDLQTNTRSERSFLVPHARMKKINGQQTRQKLVDLGDIYLNNQNIGARAVRECISTVLPTWFRSEAEVRCRETLRDGEDGEPLAKRIEGMVQAFGALGVRIEQLETKIGRKRGTWDGSHVAEMVVIYQSIQRGEVLVEDEFPRRVTAAEITDTKPEPPADDQGWPEVAQVPK